MIKAIIFDFDGMVHLAEGYFSAELVRRYGIGENLVSEFFKKDYRKCAIGELDIREALKPYLKRWEFPGDVDEFLKIWFEYGEFDEEMLELIRELKGPVRCILGTNNEKNRMDYYKELDVFDALVSSYMVGKIKPEKEFMDFLVKKAGCKKEEILFCDDKPGFIKIAEDYGFRTHYYTDIENFKKTLEELKLL